MARKPYPSDLTEQQWKLIEPFIPPERWGGRTRAVDMREVVNGLMYLLRSGCAWRAIPHDLPNASTCRHYYDRFRADGTWHLIHEKLRDRARARSGRATPSRPPPSSTPRACRRRKNGGPRVRRGQEGERPQASPGGRHAGVRAGRAGHQRGRAGRRQAGGRAPVVPGCGSAASRGCA